MAWTFNVFTGNLDYFVEGISQVANVGSSPNSAGAVISGSSLILEPADGTHPGVITSGAQTIGGVKTFTSAPNLSSLTASEAVVTDSSNNLASLAYTNANTASTIVSRDSSGNFSAGTITATLTGTASGNTTYSANNHGVVLSSGTNAMVVVAPDASTTKVLVSGGASANPSWQDIATGALALGSFGSTPNSNAAALSGATLTLEPADATHPGGVSISTQAFGGGKTITGNADEVQLLVKGNGTQTGNILEVRNSSNTLEVGISKTGQIQANEIFASGTGDIVLTSYKMYNSSGSFTVDWGNDLLSDNSQRVSVDWANRTLKNTAGTATIDFSGTNPTLVAPALGTPVSGTLTNCTSLPISTGVSGLASGIATFLGTPTSANLAAALTDETGTGSAVFANTPTLVTPILGTPTSGTLTNCTGLPLTSGITGTLGVANGGTGATIDLAPGSFSAANNQASAANVTGLAFSTSTIRAFTAFVSVSIVAGSSLFEYFTLNGIYNGSSWQMSATSVGDASGVVFTITNAGQVQYTSISSASFTSNTMKFRAICSPQ